MLNSKTNNTASLSNASQIIDIQNLFKPHGVSIRDIVDDVITYQSQYTKNLSPSLVANELYKVLTNPEVYDTIMTAGLVDYVATTKDIYDLTPSQFKSVISKLQSDYMGYGIDEQLGISIAKQYGSISEASFGDLDNNKFGVAKKLDTVGNNTMLDDIVLGIISAVSGKIARKYGVDVVTSKHQPIEFALIVNLEVVAFSQDTHDLAKLNQDEFGNLGIIRKF